MSEEEEESFKDTGYDLWKWVSGEISVKRPSIHSTSHSKCLNRRRNVVTSPISNVIYKFFLKT